jgi:hypothetical protein
MVQLINVFRGESPVGQMFRELGNSMFGDQASGELRRQQAYAAQRANTETDNLMRLVGQPGGLDALTPAAAAMLIGSGYSPDDYGRIGNLATSTTYGARDPRTTNWAAGLGEYGNTAEAFDLGLAETARNNDLQSSDRRYGTDVGARTSIANNAADNAAALARQNALPLATTIDGAPAWTTQGTMAGSPILTQTEAQGLNLMNLFPDLSPLEQRVAVDAAPSLTQVQGDLAAENIDDLGGMDEYQQRFLGVETDQSAAGSPKNYYAPDGTIHITYDGITDAQTNAPLPPGGQIISTQLQGGAGDIGVTNAVKTDLQSDLLSINRFNDLAGMMMEMVEDPDTTWGAPAWFEAKFQEIAQGVGQLVDYIRPEDAETVARFLPEMYNPNLPAQQTLYTLMLYTGAAALAGQQGRSVSDADIRQMRAAIPDPTGFFTSRESMRAALGVLGTVLQGYEARATEALQQGVGNGEAPAPAAPAFPVGVPVEIEPGVTIQRLSP